MRRSCWQSCGWAMGLSLLVACGDAVAPNCCDYCAVSQVCLPDRCCVDTCTEGACAPGHRCELGLCLPDCDQSLCGAREECSGPTGDCVAVSECGFLPENGCLDATRTLCDPFADRCYRENGACAVVGECPTFGGTLSPSTTVSCDGVSCRVGPPSSPAIASADVPEPTIDVDSPARAGDFFFATVEDVRFEWRSTTTTSLVIVTTEVPSTLAGVSATLTWGATVPAGESASRYWREGVSFADGGWLTGEAPIPPDMDRVLYFSVFAVIGNDVRAVSRAVPFRVGTPWPGIDSTCGDVGTVGGQCASPAVAMTCTSTRRCRPVCLSNADCLAAGLSMCGPRDGARRYCP